MARRTRSGGLPWLRLALAALLVAALVDFLVFRQGVLTARGEPAGEADAIVVLTGGSGLRIAEAVRLLDAGTGERLLISGVHPDLTLNELAERAGGPLHLYGCCVDVGRRARTTFGNGREVRDWAAERGYDRLILVTSDYHMPRSRLVIARALPDVELIAHPVRTRIDPARTFRDWRSLRGMVSEWAKYRIVWALPGLGRGR